MNTLEYHGALYLSDQLARLPAGGTRDTITPPGTSAWLAATQWKRPLRANVIIA